MSSSSSAVSASSSSPEPPSPAPLKRKRKENITTTPDAGSDSDSDDSNNESDDAEPSPEVPVLSHAERRRQKKKEKLESLQESAAKKRKLKDGTAAPVNSGKRQNSVWVGNMAFKTTPENLRTFFEGVGEITRINMPTKAPAGPSMKPENRGFAYVDFALPEGKIGAIARSELPLLGRKLLIKDGGDFSGRPAAAGAEGTGTSSDASKTHSKTAQKILRVQKQPPAPTLFLGNLGFETTEAAIRELFEAHRVVPKKPKDKDEPEADGEKKQGETKDVWLRKVRMGTFEDSGLCKGFAFVDFTTIEHATAVLINPKNHTLNGRKLVVEYAGADAVRRGAPKAKREAPVPSRRKDTQPRGHRPDRPDRAHYGTPRHKPKEDLSEEPVVEDQQPVKHHRYGERNEHTQSTGVKQKGPRVRPKPGAALALAKRESAAIIPSKGQKITF